MLQDLYDNLTKDVDVNNAFKDFNLSTIGHLLQRRCQRMLAALADKKGEKKDLTDVLKRKKNAVVDREAGGKAEGEINSAKLEEEAAQQKLDDVQKDIVVMYESSGRKVSRHYLTKAASQKSQEENQMIETMTKEFTASNDALTTLIQSNFEQLKDAVEDVAVKVELVHYDVKDMGEGVKQLLRNGNGKVEKLEQENAELKNDNETLKKENGKVGELEQENAELKNDNETLKKENGKVEELKKENTELKNDNEALNKKIVELEKL